MAIFQGKPNAPGVHVRFSTYAGGFGGEWASGQSRSDEREGSAFYEVSEASSALEHPVRRLMSRSRLK